MSYVKTALQFPAASEQREALMKMAAGSPPKPKRMPVGEGFKKQVDKYIYGVVDEAFAGDPLLEKTKRDFLRSVGYVTDRKEWATVTQYDMVEWLEGKSKPSWVYQETFPEMLAFHISRYSVAAIGTLREDAEASLKNLTSEQQDIAAYAAGVHRSSNMSREIEDMGASRLKTVIAIFEWASKIPPYPKG